MATTYSFLLEGKNPTGRTVQLIADILDKGYTYDVVRGAIFHCFHNHLHFPFRKFSQPIQQNLLKQSVRYYHKELTVRSGFQVEIHDVDTGDITGSPSEYWIEPRASYTLDDLVTYFQKNVPYNAEQYSYNRLKGIFRNYVEKLGLDITMFMIEHAIRMAHSDRVTFDYQRFDDYQPIARQYLADNKESVAYSGGVEYVLRERMLLD